MQSAFPPPLPSQEIIGLALNTLNQDAGVLALIAIVMAIFGGMGLFYRDGGKICSHLSNPHARYDPTVSHGPVYASSLRRALPIGDLR